MQLKVDQCTCVKFCMGQGLRRTWLENEVISLHTCGLVTHMWSPYTHVMCSKKTPSGLTRHPWPHNRCRSSTIQATTCIQIIIVIMHGCVPVIYTINSVHSHDYYVLWELGHKWFLEHTSEYHWSIWLLVLLWPLTWLLRPLRARPQVVSYINLRSSGLSD